MPKLILLRHLQSQWNLENRFTGWTDVTLSEGGIKSAKEVAEKLSNSQIDVVYTSPLKRNRSTVQLILECLNRKNIPVIVNKALDERNYGELQGLNKDEVKKQYGEEQVRLWRRSWDQAPPGGESLKAVFKRVMSFYEKNIEKDLKKGKNVLVVASHNSLRALVKYLEKVSDKNVINLELPTGSLREYEIGN